MAGIISIEWDEHANLTLRDIPTKHRHQVEEYVRQHFLNNEIYKILKYPQDPNCQQDLNTLLKHLLKNDCSIVVWNEQTHDIQAVALVKWMSEEWHSWTDVRLLITGQRFKELIELIRGAVLGHASELGEKYDSLHLFYYYIEPNWQEDECFVSRFFKAICEVARHMHMPRVTYMALSQRDGGVLEREGFEEIECILYSMYVYRGYRPFDHLRDVNEMYASLYEIKVEALIPFDQK